MLNHCTFIGRLGKDPEVRYSKDGKAIANLSIAVSKKYKGVETTEWVRFVFFDKVAEICQTYLTKGALVYVSGEIKTSQYEKDGITRYSTEFIGRDMRMLGGKMQGDESKEDKTWDVKETTTTYREPGQDDDFVEDDIPF